MLLRSVRRAQVTITCAASCRTRSEPAESSSAPPSVPGILDRAPIAIPVKRISQWSWPRPRAVSPPLLSWPTSNDFHEVTSETLTPRASTAALRIVLDTVLARCSEGTFVSDVPDFPPSRALKGLMGLNAPQHSCSRDNWGGRVS